MHDLTISERKTVILRHGRDYRPIMWNFIIINLVVKITFEEVVIQILC